MRRGDALRCVKVPSRLPRSLVSPSKQIPSYRIEGLRLVSELNTRGHWSKRHERTKKQHWLVISALGVFRGEVLRRVTQWRDDDSILRVIITRVGPRTLDTDNLSGSAKAIRDAIARRLGVDDGSQKYRWEYRQAKGAYAVEIELVWGVP